MGYHDELLQIGGNNNHGHTLFRQLLKDFVNLMLGTDIDTCRRLIDDENLEVSHEPLAEDNLLPDNSTQLRC